MKSCNIPFVLMNIIYTLLGYIYIIILLTNFGFQDNYRENNSAPPLGKSWLRPCYDFCQLVNTTYKSCMIVMLILFRCRKPPVQVGCYIYHICRFRRCRRIPKFWTNLFVHSFDSDRYQTDASSRTDELSLNRFFLKIDSFRDISPKMFFIFSW